MTRRVEDNLFRAHRVDEMMRHAIGLTEATAPHPNPRVGAIVVNPAGEVVAERAHIKAGTAHAEAAALSDAGPAGRGSTLIVTLEPCAHHGTTPPCAEAIIQAGVRRVFVGALDPDVRVAGRDLHAAKVRESGIGVLDSIARAEVFRGGVVAVGLTGVVVARQPSRLGIEHRHPRKLGLQIQQR